MANKRLNITNDHSEFKCEKSDVEEFFNNFGDCAIVLKEYDGQRLTQHEISMEELYRIFERRFMLENYKTG